MDFDVTEFTKHIHQFGEVEAIEIGDNGHHVASVPQGRQLTSLKKFIDEYRLSPERLRGIANVTDLPSFIGLTKRGLDPQSVLYAKRDRKAPSLTAILNYNYASTDGADPRFGDHRVHYAFPVSDEWKAWHEKNGQKLGQRDFAEFLEDRIVDIAEPPKFDTEEVAGSAISLLARAVGSTFAGPSRLLELSRGMAVSAGLKVKQAVNVSSGEAKVVFEEEHTNELGAPLTVPNLFMIAIPIFDRGPLYQIGVRLRYRIASGSMLWFYELYQPEKSFDHAFDEACYQAQADTGLPLFYGTPEANNS
jgi:uncharacterized protein YfdQ (DUF2303 family)